jgi:hypothetical protein
MSTRRRSQSTSYAAQEPAEGSDGPQEMAPPQNTHARRRIAPTAQEPSGSKTHYKLADENDCVIFSCMANHEEANLRAVKVLEVHLDASKLDEFIEFRLATALTTLHPRVGGINPHNLQVIKLIVKGGLLFTRYSYHLSSPAMSHLVGDKLKRLAMGTLTVEEEAALPFQINSTEKGFSKALLGIRGVKTVLIQGRGMMEGNFVETIKATLVQSPGTDEIEVRNPGVPASTWRLNSEGEFYSKGYGAKALRPYPTRSASSMYNFENLPERRRYLVDEKKELVGHFLGLSQDDARSAAIVKSSVPLNRRQIETYDVGPVTKTRSQKHGMTTNEPKGKEKGKQVKQESESEDEDGGLVFSDMVRVKVKKDHREDDGTVTASWDVMPLIITSKAASVELGWKVT